MQISLHTTTLLIIIGLLVYGSQRLDYIHTVNITQPHNHTIKYELMSFVVGEAIAYKRILKPISPCKNNWEFVSRSKTISD